MYIHCVCSTKTCPTTGWTGWAFRPPCTETRTAPGPCRLCTSTTGPSCTPTSTRTPPTPTPCLPVWAPRLTTLSREIKTLYTGRCKPPVRGQTHSLAGGRVSRPRWGSRGGLVVAKSAPYSGGKKTTHRFNARDGRAILEPKLLQRRWERERLLPLGLPLFLNTLDLYDFKVRHFYLVFLLNKQLNKY